MLQSLSPKLDKPILLLTYKNHALDEFLKQILGFCKIEEIVRIGGRSKESQLESCNLKKIQSGINYDNATRAEIQSTKAEIAAIESKIREVSKKVEASSYLTQSSLVDELEEEQLQTLIIEAGWGSKSMTYRLDKKIADKKRMKKLLDSVSHIYESVKKFLQIAMQNRLEKSEHIGLHCINIFRKAFQNWFPDRKELQKMKEFQSAFILQIQSDSTTDEDTSKESDHKSKKSENADDDDSGDEEHVKHLLETRNAGAKQGVKSDDLLLFDLTEAKTKNEILVKMSEYPPNMVVSSQIRNVNNLWSLNEIQRLQFLYCILNEKTTRVSQELNDLIKQMQTLINRREELEMTEKVKLLSDKKIIGVTITGASINHDLIHRIGPSVVIVEEAAEILEPSLLAALTSSIEHLILIGDHKQLRPQVDTYELCKNFNFDVSMMERLINSGFPFRSLAKQNRMRPEFSALLHDIYPNLEDNMPLVSQNMPLNCIEKSMFFWCHDDPEKKDRTYSNVKEAERIIALVMFLLRNGVRPSDITVLAAYQGQTKLLRKMMKQENRSTPQFFKEYDESGEEIEDSVDVQTIDMYQGDENKYVIISLVRSNKENRIGFLNKMSRRCVAQSRAKCGMYFVGNLNTLRGAKSSCWLKLITGMMEQGCVGHEFPLQCTRHETSKYKAKDSYSMKEVNAKPTLLCNRLCGNAYSNCDKHHCNKLCFPSHSHASCPVRIDDRFPDCGHEIKRRCHEKISDLRCPVQSVINLPCGHTGKKKCFQNVSDVRCAVRVTATFPQCGHKTKKPCYVDMWTIKCQYHCREINSCGIHRCKYICGNDHRHDNCQELIDYLFPQCKHPSPRKKKCSDEIFWKCRYKVTFMGTCGHPIKKECNQHEGEVTCSVMPCTRLRKCGHPCANSCGEDCEKGECKQCLQVFHKKMEKFREAAMRRVKELEKKIKKKEIPKFFRDEIRDTGSTAAEYQKVKDQVLNFIQPCHHWFPSITKIEKVTNLELEKKFEVAKSKAFGDHIDIKFHGTSNNNLNNIIKDGFKMPDQKPPTSKRGMFGQGIYFATDSSKSAQKIYTQGSQKLLLCQVILGRSKQVRKADYTLNKQKLRSKQYDSVYAPRGSAVKNDEFVIFDPDQALPQYIIHFSDAVVPPSPLTLKVRERFKVKKLTPLRTVDIKDPFQMYYNWADSHFRRMAASSKPPLSKQQANIKSIDIVINKDLEGKFEATKKTFQNQGISDKEILAYHGTDKKNIDSILRHNLQLSYAKRQAYGKGNYFSEFPSISLGYGDGLLLCRILPGKEFVDASSSNIPEGFNSKKVLLSTQNAHFSGATTTTASSSSTDVSGEMIIIENPDQILPFFVIHR